MLFFSSLIVPRPLSFKSLSPPPPPPPPPTAQTASARSTSSYRDVFFQQLEESKQSLCTQVTRPSPYVTAMIKPAVDIPLPLREALLYQSVRLLIQKSASVRQYALVLTVRFNFSLSLSLSLFSSFVFVLSPFCIYTYLTPATNMLCYAPLPFPFSLFLPLSPYQFDVHSQKRQTTKGSRILRKVKEKLVIENDHDLSVFFSVAGKLSPGLLTGLFGDPLVESKKVISAFTDF